jgi:NADH-quinone oxidoreductase subunit L
MAILLIRIGRPIRDYAVVFFTFLGFLMALLMLPEIVRAESFNSPALWISLPGGGSISIGMLIDPLSIILANIVAFLSLAIMIYSVKYVEHEPGQDRYWFFMSIFITSMLLLVLADNLILMFIGWKMVGICSYALIGHYYSDEEEHWLGGPDPFPFRTPSRAGLKALLVTTFGDVSLLGGIVFLYTYSGTLSFLELYQTADVWLAALAADPGALTLLSVLLLGGPIAKSAQFPLHEWLPEAMAGPTPVSALIHAATMVKAGVYFIARLIPVFFYATWIADYPEAFTFFAVTAAVGAITAFLTGTQAMVAVELKKVLAYSTMSQIGYMILGLGLAGFTSHSMTLGLTAGIFHLISHGIFKAALFLCAGVIIHTTGSIYMSEMNLSRRSMRYTWIFMWVATMSLMGIPPLSGFWSKEEILSLSFETGQFILFALALVTVAFTAFYSVRFMGKVFHKNDEEDQEDKEASPIMLIPYGILAVLSVAVGAIGPWFGEQIEHIFKAYFVDFLGFEVHSGAAGSIAPAAQSAVPLTLLLPLLSLVMIVIGAVPAYRFYVSHASSSEALVEGSGILQRIQMFLRKRWHINSSINRVFVDGTIRYRYLVQKYIEDPLDCLFNEGIPRLFSGLSKGLRRLQTGLLSINIQYILLFILLALISIVFLVVP